MRLPSSDKLGYQLRFLHYRRKENVAGFDADGSVTMQETVDLGLTIDERIADGYYYSKTIRLLKKLLENPVLLETPANEKVEY